MKLTPNEINISQIFIILNDFAQIKRESSQLKVVLPIPK